MADKLGVDIEKVTPEARFVEDLGADSLDGTELMMAIEEEFNIKVEDDEATSLKTVSDIVRFLRSKGISE